MDKDKNMLNTNSERQKKFRKKNKSITVVYTLDQYELLTDICKKNAINDKPYPLRRWIKERSLDKTIRVKQHIVEHKIDKGYVLQLSRIGNLLNQIARGVNTLKEQIDTDVAELYMQEVTKCTSEINKIMKLNEIK